MKTRTKVIWFVFGMSFCLGVVASFSARELFYGSLEYALCYGVMALALFLTTIGTIWFNRNRIGFHPFGNIMFNEVNTGINLKRYFVLYFAGMIMGGLVTGFTEVLFYRSSGLSIPAYVVFIIVDLAVVLWASSYEL